MLQRQGGGCKGAAHIDEQRSPSAPFQIFLQIFPGNPPHDCGIGDLISIQVQDGEDSAILLRIQETAALPSGGKRAGLRFAVSHDTGCDQSGIIQHGAEGMCQTVAEFSALVDGAGQLGSCMALDPAGK